MYNLNPNSAALYRNFVQLDEILGAFFELQRDTEGRLGQHDNHGSKGFHARLLDVRHTGQLGNNLGLESSEMNNMMTFEI